MDTSHPVVLCDPDGFINTFQSLSTSSFTEMYWSSGAANGLIHGVTRPPLCFLSLSPLLSYITVCGPYPDTALCVAEHF